MAKKQHRSQSNLRAIAEFAAQPKQATQPKPAKVKKEKKKKEIILDMMGVNVFSPAISSRFITQSLRNETFDSVLIVTPQGVYSFVKLPKELGKSQVYRVATTGRRAYFGPKADCIQFIAESASINRHCVA